MTSYTPPAPTYQGRIRTKHIGDAQVSPAKIGSKGTYIFERTDHQPSLSLPNGYSDPTGTAADICRTQFRRGLTSQYYQRVGQTLLGPLLDTVKGLDVSQDQTNADGVEHVFGCLGTNSPYAYTIGTHNFFIRALFRIESVAGSAHCLFGFRKNVAFNATALTSYADFVTININAGAPETKTNVGAAGTVTTVPSPAPTVWADTETHEVMIKVQGQTPTFFFDRTPLKGLPAYTFTNALVMVPFFSFLQGAGTTTVFWKEIEIGQLSDINSSGLNA